HLPAMGVDRRKQGFEAPVARWLARDWVDMVHDLVLGPHVERRGWFRREALQWVVDENTKRHNPDDLLWTLLILELWVRQSTQLPLLDAQQTETHWASRPSDSSHSTTSILTT